MFIVSFLFLRQCFCLLHSIFCTICLINNFPRSFLYPTFFCETLLLPIHSSATSVTAFLIVLHCSSTFDPRSCKTWNLLCSLSLYLSVTSSFFSFPTGGSFIKEVLFIFLNLSLSEALISWCQHLYSCLHVIRQNAIFG